MQRGNEDLSDPKKTTRVMTLMLATRRTEAQQMLAGGAKLRFTNLLDVDVGDCVRHCPLFWGTAFQV